MIEPRYNIEKFAYGKTLSLKKSGAKKMNKNCFFNAVSIMTITMVITILIFYIWMFFSYKKNTDQIEDYTVNAQVFEEMEKEHTSITNIDENIMNPEDVINLEDLDGSENEFFYAEKTSM